MIERASRGFTLLELMIVVVIVGILASIAYPSYTQQVIKSRRTDAQQALTGLANLQERNYLNSGAGVPPTYTTNLKALGYPTTPTTRTPDDMYNLSVAPCTGGTIASCFELSAEPVSGKMQAKDSDCKTLTLTSKGEKTATGPKGLACW